ncbi:MAG: M23 family metallopeptidase [Clostridia bacterium]|nr:M23 family metallopeptidase [Clostridia bacterium]
MASVRSGKRTSALLAIILCVPIAFIVYFIIAYSSQTLTLSNVNRITIQATGAEDSVISDKDDIAFFVDTFKSAKTINTAIRDITGEEPVYIIFERSDRTLVYRLYPSLNLTGCMMIGPDNKLSVLDSEDAGKLLLRREFDYLYYRNFLPKLYIVSGGSKTEVRPADSNWTYIKSDGNEYAYVPDYATGEELYTVYRGNENSLIFDPDGDMRPYEISNISFTSENGVIFNITDIAELDLSIDTKINVSFDVKWSGLNGAECYGDARYDFDVMYDIPAEITLSSEEYAVGEVIAVCATHFNPDEKIAMKTDLFTTDLCFTATDTDKGVALLPIGLENEPGEYSIVFTTGAGEQSFSVTVKALENGETWLPVSVTDEEYETMFTDETLGTVYAVLASAAEFRPDEDYFIYGVNAMQPPVRQTEIRYDFGVRASVTNPNVLGVNLTVNGRAYAVPKDTKVRSAQKGVVMLSEELPTVGNAVVVYHGYGIYTYYFHLDGVNVNVGDVLTSGEIIGTAGTTGFTNGETLLHFAVSVDGIFVDPSEFIK